MDESIYGKILVIFLVNFEYRFFNIIFLFLWVVYIIKVKNNLGIKV